MDGGRGGETPDELETLLEDACILRDADAIARLFEDGSLLVTGQRLVHGRDAILQAASLLIGEGVINVARRGTDGSWRFSISMLSAMAGTQRENDSIWWTRCSD